MDKTAQKLKNQREFGDFQTPLALADKIISRLIDLGINPRTVLEPTCGEGSFLLASMDNFKGVTEFIGLDINEQYLASLRSRVSAHKRKRRLRLIAGDFFSTNWLAVLDNTRDPILIIGNPPWVTSAELGTLGSKNLPQKSNFQGRRGFDAISGKSNFDISEWMLLQYFDWLRERCGIIAVLCKTAVARKILFQAWEKNLSISKSLIFLVDAQRYFGAAVDACLFVTNINFGKDSKDCAIYKNIKDANVSQIIGYRDGLVLADVDRYQKWKYLSGADSAYIWRSGIKHDCSQVMELESHAGGYKNGVGETQLIEDIFVYPMLKSSDISNGDVRYGRKFMLVTQRYVGEATEKIKKEAPRTWKYLQQHTVMLEKRASSIYKNRPKYSIFGVGPYSFAPWKVAISGFYKQLSFKIINPFRNRTVVLDDTVCFLPCWSENEARFIFDMLNSKPAQEFYQSMIFWTEKRPITIEILKRLNIQALSAELGRQSEYLLFARRRRDNEEEEINHQFSLGIAENSRVYKTRSVGTKRTGSKYEKQQH